MSDNETAMVIGERQGIGAVFVGGFLNTDYNFVGASLAATTWLCASSRLVLVDGGIIDSLMNNARICHQGTGRCKGQRSELCHSL